MSGCPACGLFLTHVPGCRGVIAVYWQYGTRHEEDGFRSVDEACSMLMSGEDYGSLSAESIVLADGTVLMDADTLTDRYVHGWKP